MKRVLLFGLLGWVLAASTGCGLGQAIFCYRPCAMRGGCCGCGDAGCDQCASAPCSPRRVAGCTACDDGCDSCGACDSCGTCGDCGCRPWHRGPLSCLFALMTRGCWWGPNCGERYWGDFYSDPPDCWDPCDGCGNYTGGNAVYRGSHGSGTYGGGCPTCGRRGAARPRGEFYEEADGDEAVDEGAATQPERIATPPAKQPTNQPHRAVKQQ